MTDPLEDRLREAMSSGVSDFSPAQTIGATRSQLVGRVRRRQRQVLSGGAALLLVAAGAVALELGPPGGSSGRPVAARGANGSPSTTVPASRSGASGTAVTAGTSGGPGAAGGPGGSTVIGAARPTYVTTPSLSTAPGGPHSTTVPPPATTSSTAPVVTSPSTTIPAAGSQVRGTVLFGPTCPVERIPPDPACAPRPGPAHIQLVRADATIAAQGDAGSNGQFAIVVAPGSYTVRAESSPANPGIGRGCTVSPAQVTVTSSAGSTVAVSCDTGIR